MTDQLNQRIAALREELGRAKIDALLVQNPISCLYLSGFSSSNALILLTRKKAMFFTDFRYIEKAKKTIKHLEVEQIPQHGIDEIAALAIKLRVKTVGFEESVSYAQYQSLKRAMGEVSLTPAGGLITRLRQVKSAKEIQIISANQRLNEQIFHSALDSVSAGDSEIAIRNHILQQMIANNCDEAFASIIASGKNSALPHATPSSQIVKQNAFLLFDMGVKKNHYHSDMTRTVAVGERLPGRAKEIYEVVLQAQLAALQLVAPGRSCKDIDAAARAVITKAGYGDFFGHGLGHGVGLEIHEGPTLNPRSSDVLLPGMVITIEPGIYIPGLGGVRIEDLVVVTKTGYRNLTNVPKALHSIAL